MRFTLTQRVLLCLAFGLLASCGVLSFDHSAKVSKALLYDANGKPDDAAFTAAMNARFPPGAKSTDVQGFIVSIGGSCSQNTPTQLYCHVSTTGTICVAHLMYFNVATSAAGTVEHIEAKGGIKAC
jgi:hypothetical protein